MDFNCRILKVNPSTDQPLKHVPQNHNFHATFGAFKDGPFTQKMTQNHMQEGLCISVVHSIKVSYELHTDFRLKELDFYMS